MESVSPVPSLVFYLPSLHSLSTLLASVSHSCHRGTGHLKYPKVSETVRLLVGQSFKGNLYSGLHKGISVN